MTGDNLTPEEQEAIARYEEANKEARKVRARQEDTYWAMIKTLGRKADCPYCGNAHWPTCEIFECE